MVKLGERSNIISLYFGPLRTPPIYLTPFSRFGSTTPGPILARENSPRTRIRVATEFALRPNSRRDRIRVVTEFAS